MRRNKYRAIPTVVDSIRFASKAEARYYQELRLLERAGKIEHLLCHPKFDLGAGIKYHADFSYVDVDRDRFIVADVKGVLTPVFRLKAKLFREKYGYEIEIVRVK